MDHHSNIWHDLTNDTLGVGEEKTNIKWILNYSFKYNIGRVALKLNAKFKLLNFKNSIWSLEACNHKHCNLCVDGDFSRSVLCKVPYGKVRFSSYGWLLFLNLVRKRWHIMLYCRLYRGEKRLQKFCMRRRYLNCFTHLIC